MKKSTLEIEILKTEQVCQFFLEGKEFSIDELVEKISKLQQKTVFFKTIEDNRILLSGFIFHKNKKQLKKHLKAAGKAQIKI